MTDHPRKFAHPQFTAESARQFERASIANMVMVKESLECGCEPYQDVFTYRRWLAQGYQVQKGQHAITLPLLITKTIEDRDTGETQQIRLRKTSAVFCRCQVKPIDEVPS